MRRRRAEGPVSGATGRRWPGWRNAIAVGWSVAIAHLAFTLAYRPLQSRVGWLVPSDVWSLVRQSRYVAAGALGYVYESGGAHSALPLFPILLAPAVLVADGLELSVGYPQPIPHPTMWIAVGVFGCLLAALPVLAAGLLAPDQARGLVQVGAALVVVLPAHAFGHFEEPLAAALVLFAIHAGLGGNLDRSAVLFGIAIATKQWALLVLPLWLVCGVPVRRLRFSALALALPASLALFLLLVDPESTRQVLLKSPAFPEAPYGHPLLWLPQWEGVIDGAPYRAAASVAAIVVAALFGRSLLSRAEKFAGLSMVLLVRALCEPVLHAYYLGPALVFALLHAAAARPEHRASLVRVLIPGFAVLAWCRLRPDPYLWWAVAYGLLGFTFWAATGTVVRSVLARARHGSSAVPTTSSGIPIP